jgi:hypothetical protein
MSTEEAVVAIAPVTLPRGAWYLLEGVCQTPAPWTTTILTTRAAKLWSKLHRANPAKSGDRNFERRIIKNEGESDIAYANRVDGFNDAFEVWQNESLSLDISKKERTTLEKGIAWALKNRDKVWPANNDKILAILTAFSIEDEEDDEIA